LPQHANISKCCVAGRVVWTLLTHIPPPPSRQNYLPTSISLKQIIPKYSHTHQLTCFRSKQAATHHSVLQIVHTGPGAHPGSYSIHTRAASSSGVPKGGGLGVSNPPPPKFRRFTKAEPNSQFRGATAPQIPVLSALYPQLKFLNPPPKKSWCKHPPPPPEIIPGTGVPRGFGGVQTPPKFRSFEKAGPNSQFRGI
jgi:hypothetical protein